MGTYTDLTIANYPVISSKSAVIPEVMTVFRETDRRVFTRRVAARNALVANEPDDPNDDEIETAIEYSCEIRKVIDRLNVMGFTLRRVREDFEVGRSTELENYASWAEEEHEHHWFDTKWQLLKGLTFDVYAKAFSRVMTDCLRPVPFDDHMKDGIVDPVIKYILGDNDEFLFGFFGSDIRLLLRLACEVAPATSRVVQDITALVNSGYYGEQEAVCENATRALTAGHPENSPQIILTEGSTDVTFLREALELLYPHLAGYYAFLDFGSSRSPGGAGHLVSLVKAFSAAGITNRIIALFDNDTAAHEARRALEAIVLPPNIAVRAYPKLELLRAYPTLGPGGLTSLDVNGLAASIELYLGEDVLREGQGTLTPVQWKGYSEVLKQYQGEVMSKPRLHATFREKVARFRANPEAMKMADWSGLSAILQEIFRAFD
ncbi:MAG: hypothetical protein JZU65_05020 [Chlorobium sp.]|jgi:hypothetical protein|nr:hypothetical protein [Chlorobium sp.]